MTSSLDHMTNYSGIPSQNQRHWGRHIIMGGASVHIKVLAPPQSHFKE